MALTEISPRKYGKLLATTLPKVIETREEFDRYVATMEQLDRSVENGGRPAQNKTHSWHCWSDSSKTLTIG